jgi:glutamate:Na+ symporter, ESS family
LVGGHGTGAAFAEHFAVEHYILGVMGLTITSATIDLVIGGIIGRPVTTPATTSSFVLSLAAALGAVIAGRALAGALLSGNLTLSSAK